MAKKYSTLSRISRPVVWPVFFFAPLSALAAGNYYDARNDAMGGTGVASSTYSSAVLANPALMTKAKPEDNVSIILPAVGAQLTDKNKLIDKVDDLTDSVDHYQDLYDNLLATPLTAAGLNTLSANLATVRAAAGDLASQLRGIKGSKASATAGAAFAVTIPNDTLSAAFVTKAYGTANVTTNVTQSDIDYLQGVADGGTIPTSNPKDTLTSSATGVGAIVYDYGIALAHEFDIAGHPVSFGVTPKLQKVYLYNYSASVYNYDKSDFTNGKYKNSDSGFNLDAGMATDLGENWTLGVSAQNLISRDIETKEVNGSKDTYQIGPVVTPGISFHTERFTAALDVDATPTKGFQSVGDSQFAGIGAEYRLLSWLQLRAGYRADMKSNQANVATAGFGLSPFNKVHLDLAGMKGDDKTWGAVAQMTFTF
ncbi:conjugal transfer protein TraF [Erwinia psidii]|uniref:Type IX secretion system membrane protein PorP/SprF n=1 Tax=Erwinia psidii TaxID=69224 RepID=A0A3N6SD42_9GAMM|nr:conjugal transfer protein TraF [Erwinia psidii]MCX8958802.1 type IX secretion system membrane protein PorP/SprF [Erwinia psidii]MCX8965952.1 type IX secretion system membrane protein PorP/SprF [Erwinia psidii]RQM36511.1 type IX secretion system membrane protein PorP/SprF [Erwinia psidii]